MHKSLVYIVFAFAPFLWGQSDIAIIGTLPQTVAETSGLLAHNGKLITHNDSGNAAELYELDPVTLQITRTITVVNAINTDWEDITQDAQFIYIGDIGNNNGDRRNLKVFKIAKSDFDSSDTVTAEEITFSYEDQTDFETVADSDFDAEALFLIGKDLIVLTKQWQRQGTVAYRIPNTPGTYTAERLGGYQIDGLVTGATYDESNGRLFLVGYSTLLAPFFVNISGSNTNAVFGDMQTKSELAIGAAQVEAITRTSDGQFYITSEEFNSPPILSSASRLFRFTLDENPEEEEEEPQDASEPPSTKEALIVYKTFGSNNLNYQLNTERTVTAMGVFDASGRLVSYVPLERITETSVDLSSLDQALYYLTFFLVDDIISAPFVKD
ncbi:hypothetical protein [uncultured Croceitalea sp.]|uniref:hypothetical protein n=1 Tax=uncultured Croceitalea sp. TaxID=1798908 RepID=UPI003306437A